MKKITIINKHLGLGKIEKYISYLTKMLENDYEINLLVTYKLKENPTFRISNKVNINYLIEDSINKNDIKKAFKRKQIFKLIEEILKFIKLSILRSIKTRKAIKNLDTDYVITTRLYETILVNKLLKNKNIIKIVIDNKYPSKIYKHKIIKATTNISKLVVLNEEIEKIYKRQIGDKVVLINNFIESVNNKKPNLNSKNLITVGMLSKEKDFNSLIEIMRIVVNEDKDVHLTIVGDGSKKRAIQSKIKELHLENNIELTGVLNQIEIDDLMSKSTLYVSTNNKKDLGLTILEAMNASLPIISFESCGARELLSNEVGVLISKKNKILFAKEIIRLLNDKEELKKYSMKSKEKVFNYTPDKAKVEWIKLIETTESLINKKVMFISSTGGHLNELLMLKPLFKKYRFSLITEYTNTNKNLKNKYGSKNVKFLLYGTRKHMLTYPFKLLINTFKSLYYYLKYRPKYIITTGAHTAGPMCLIGKIFRSKIIYIETFANSETKTVTGSIIYKFADLFIVQWESMKDLYENAIYGGWIY